MGTITNKVDKTKIVTDNPGKRDQKPDKLRQYAQILYLEKNIIGYYNK